MINILKNFLNIIKEEVKKPTFYSIIVLAILFCVISFFDKALAVGLLLLLFLFVATIFIIYKTGVKDKEIYTIFLLATIVHLGAVLFIYYGDFKPFGGGADFQSYDKIATEIAHRFQLGNFSLDGLYTDHFFPILIGILYMFVLPSMIVGQLFTVWLAAVSILLVYLIVLEIGGTKKIAFLTSIIIIFYPSYLYFGSVLLKDTIVIPLALVGVLLMLKMVKNFSWIKFLLFFVILTCLINLRFYIGYALMFAFIISWPFLSRLSIKEKIICQLVIIFILGFSPQIVGNGYYASDSFKKLLNPKSITYYREVVYNSNNLPSNLQPEPASEPAPPPVPVIAPQPPTTPLIVVPQPSPLIKELPRQELNGSGSNFELETGFNEGFLKFLKNSSKSFLYSLLGPFPWQIKHQRQIMSLAETIPWYLLIIISLYGFVNFIRKKGILEFLKFYKSSLPLLVFSILALGALALFINNYGIIVRIRIPIFICLISIMLINLNDDIENYYKKIYEKIFNNRRGWFHWASSFRNTFKTGA